MTRCPWIVRYETKWREPKSKNHHRHHAPFFHYLIIPGKRSSSSSNVALTGDKHHATHSYCINRNIIFLYSLQTHDHSWSSSLFSFSHHHLKKRRNHHSSSSFIIIISISSSNFSFNSRFLTQWQRIITSSFAMSQSISCLNQSLVSQSASEGEGGKTVAAIINVGGNVSQHIAYQSSIHLYPSTIHPSIHLPIIHPFPLHAFTHACLATYVFPL